MVCPSCSVEGLIRATLICVMLTQAKEWSVSDLSIEYPH